MEVSKANVLDAEAVIGQAEAAIRQAEATLKQATINLGYCDIKSPVKGTIVNRRVNVGQTVVSSLSASSLFLLAQDLSRIQVWASVNEANIGRIRSGVKVHFTVNAYPNDVFHGEVSQVRLNATMTQNVVTYTVVVTTENKDRRLLPYMTANLQFEIERHENVLKVPNAALRWKPRPKRIAPDVRADTLAAMNRHDDKSKRDDNKAEAAKGSGQNSVLSAQNSVPGAQAAETARAKVRSWPPPQEPPPAGSNRQAASIRQTAVAQKEPKERHESSRLWVVDGNFVRPVPVRIIATDGTMTEVHGKDISEGLEVVIGESVASDAKGDTTNPFMPKLARPNPNKPNNSGSTKP